MLIWMIIALNSLLENNIEITDDTEIIVTEEIIKDEELDLQIERFLDYIMKL